MLGPPSDLPQREPGASRHPAASSCSALTRPGADLDPYRSPSTRHLGGRARCRPALDAWPRTPRRAGLGEQRRRDLGGQRRVGQARRRCGRAALLHHDRRDPRVVGARPRAARRRRGRASRRWRRRRWPRAAPPAARRRRRPRLSARRRARPASCWEVVEVAGAGAEAGGRDGHRRERAPAVDDGRPGGRRRSAW